jgi:hypothetical protein
MKKKSETKRRRRVLPLALFGLLLGAGVAYALVHWRHVLMPELQLLPDPDEVSIYEVSGDVTRDWPAGLGAAIGSEPGAAEPEDGEAALWGDVPAMASTVGAGAVH